MIDFIAKYWMAIGVLAFVGVVVIGNIIETREANRSNKLRLMRGYMARHQGGAR